MLGKGDGNQSFLGIDLAIGRCRSIPTELPKAGWHGALAGIDAYLHAQPEAFRTIEPMRAFGKRREMIGGHQLNRLPAQDPFAIESAAVAKHLRETRVIVHGAEQACAA